MRQHVVLLHLKRAVSAEQLHPHYHSVRQVLESALVVCDGASFETGRIVVLHLQRQIGAGLLNIKTPHLRLHSSSGTSSSTTSSGRPVLMCTATATAESSQLRKHSFELAHGPCASFTRASLELGHIILLHLQRKVCAQMHSNYRGRDHVRAERVAPRCGGSEPAGLYGGLILLQVDHTTPLEHSSIVV